MWASYSRLLDEWMARASAEPSQVAVEGGADVIQFVEQGDELVVRTPDRGIAEGRTSRDRVHLLRHRRDKALHLIRGTSSRRRTSRPLRKPQGCHARLQAVFDAGAPGVMAKSSRDTSMCARSGQRRAMSGASATGGCAHKNQTGDWPAPTPARGAPSRPSVRRGRASAGRKRAHCGWPWSAGAGWPDSCQRRTAGRGFAAVRSIVLITPSLLW